MPKQQRLSRIDFSKIDVSRTRRYHGELFTLSVAFPASESPIHKPKFACVVSKKAAAHAVERNRIRRCAKEILRKVPDLITQSKNPKNLVFYAKKDAKTASFHDIEADILKLVSMM